MDAGTSFFGGSAFIPMTKILARVCGLLCALIPIGCSELSSIERGSCGNGILEEGEDCDNRKNPACVACRLTCSTESCPTGWGCGVDKTCREPTGTYERRELPTEYPASFLTRANFDGEGGDELLVRTDQVVAHYFDDQRNERVRYKLSMSAAGLARQTETVVRLNEDTRDDLVVASDDSLSILLGQADGPPTLLSYTERTKFSEARAFAARFMNNGPLRSLMLLSGSNLYTRDQWTEGEPFMTLPITAGQVSERISVDGASGTDCDRAAFGVERRAFVINLCDGGDGAWVQLPEGFEMAQGVMFAEVDGNSSLDLLALARVIDDDSHDDGDGVVTFVAFGAADGSFHSAPLPAGAGDGSFASIPFLNSKVLATGHLNGDAISDFVSDHDGIVISGPAERGFPCTTQGNYSCDWGPVGTWNYAEIADFNRNGLPDIIAGEWNVAQLAFLNGAGDGAFNQASVALPGPIEPSLPAVSDFDGDLLDDFAFAFKQSVANSKVKLAILFGQAHAFPSQFRELELSGSSPQIVAGYSDQIEVDKISDLAVISTIDAVVHIARFEGRADREIYSPLTLSSEDADGKRVRHAISAVAAGNFTSEGRQQLAVLGAYNAVSALHYVAPPEVVSQEPTVLPGELRSVAISVGDYDPDGRDDVLLGGYPSGSQVTLATNAQGTWTLAPPVTVPNATSLDGLQVRADFDGDGVRDVIFGNYRSTEFEPFLFTTNGSGRINFELPTVLSVDSGTLLTLQARNADLDAESELAVLVHHTDARELRVIVVDIDLSSGKLLPKDGMSFLLSDSMREAVDYVRAQIVTNPGDLPGFSMFAPDALFGMATGDFDGNGLDDLAVADVAVNIFFATARNERVSSQ